ncbi:unnamed protein product [Darwinula stevensoni]|uniref:Oxysterol-binding protein n=1 Tax=Darwinula stevensoni TaxID=69355 RepID=A0A7R9FNW1_9CRUS|nr:unnamed protein product [Darwinula stevensoni]CAG0897205.1 unnamed protein product [Darwinula stevensoni]
MPSENGISPFPFGNGDSETGIRKRGFGKGNSENGDSETREISRSPTLQLAFAVRRSAELGRPPRGGSRPGMEMEMPNSTGPEMRQPLQGQLLKFTNVVKGWQYRHFILDPERGILEYYVDAHDSQKKSRPRGFVHLAGAVISPSDEDSQTFTVNAACGEVYKLKALDAKERQHWVMRIRAVCERHTQAIAQSNPPLPPREHRNHSSGTPPVDPRVNYPSLTVMDAFSSARHILNHASGNHQALAAAIEKLPTSGNGLTCTNPELLLLKATSHATLNTLEQCLNILQLQQQAILLGASSSHMRSQKRRPKQTMPSQAPLPAPLSAEVMWTGPTVTTIHSTTQHHVISPQTLNELVEPVVIDAADEETDSEDNPGEMQEKETTTTEEYKARILTLLSPLQLGMDLTKVSLPTFILEPKSLLETFADFMGHGHQFFSLSACCRIVDEESPEQRMLAVVEWYLCTIHLGRRGSSAKKPYNPTLGESFYCSWKIPRGAAQKPDQNQSESASSPDSIFIRYTGEQVSHHPPVSAFYVECPEKGICFNAHILSKTRFMGMSIGVNLVGEGKLYLVPHNECYTLTFPSAYGRAILTSPWSELGGKVTISCSNSGIAASITFHTKPYFGDKLHRVTGDIKDSLSQVIWKFQGDWVSGYDFTHSAQGTGHRLDLKNQKIFQKRVRPVTKQEDIESRKLWQNVSMAILEGDYNTATEHKKFLEDRERAKEAERLGSVQEFSPRYFQPQGDNVWIYKEPLCPKGKLKRSDSTSTCSSGKDQGNKAKQLARDLKDRIKSGLS